MRQLGKEATVPLSVQTTQFTPSPAWAEHFSQRGVSRHFDNCVFPVHPKLLGKSGIGNWKFFQLVGWTRQEKQMWELRRLWVQAWQGLARAAGPWAQLTSNKKRANLPAVSADSHKVDQSRCPLFFTLREGGWMPTTSLSPFPLSSSFTYSPCRKHTLLGSWVRWGCVCMWEESESGAQHSPKLTSSHLKRSLPLAFRQTRVCDRVLALSIPSGGHFP